jgi:hypothetical protein
MKTAVPQHYALVSEGEMDARHADATWHGFVEPISYGAGRGDLLAFLLKHFPAPTATAAKKQRSSGKSTRLQFGACEAAKTTEPSCLKTAAR